MSTNICQIPIMPTKFTVLISLDNQFNQNLYYLINQTEPNQNQEITLQKSVTNTFFYILHLMLLRDWRKNLFFIANFEIEVIQNSNYNERRVFNQPFEDKNTNGSILF